MSGFTTTREIETLPSIDGEITTNERILTSATKNISLLKILSETEYANSALIQAQAYHNDLIQDHGLQTSNLQVLLKSLAKEQKEHEAYRDSTMKRLAYRAAGRKERFASKAEKEEREYLQAVQNHFAAKQQIAHLESQIKGSDEHVDILKKMKVKHDRAQKNLDSLYDSIFEGPTPEFPVEDQSENKVNALRHQYANVQKNLSVENQALAILRDADKFLHKALADLRNASEASTMDVWGVGGSYADFSERSSLASAQSNTSQVSGLLGQAKRLQPAIEDIGPMGIAQGHVMSDIVFDNVFSDMQMHDEIGRSVDQVQQAGLSLSRELVKGKDRAEEIKRALLDIGGKLEEARKELEDVRRATFEKVTGGLPEYVGASPEYKE